MIAGGGEAAWAAFYLARTGLLPSAFDRLGRREKAYLAAAGERWLEEEKEESRI